MDMDDCLRNKDFFLTLRKMLNNFLKNFGEFREILENFQKIFWKISKIISENFMN